jgi:predicted HD phosphohydrolase
MSTADQRHAYGVARRVVETLEDNATRPVVAAALLHDIGKIESGLGTFGRSAATVLANVGLKPASVVRYRAHNEIGRRLLQAAGSEALTSTWAYEHELPQAQWSVDATLAQALHDADDD